MNLNIPQIPIEPRGTVFTNDNFVYYNFYQSPVYGSLNRKHEDYNERHIFMNTLIQDIFIKHALIHGQNDRIHTHSFSDNHYTNLFQIETLIYWIRKNMDEMISMNYYASYYKREGKEPPKLKISSIGTLINKPESDVYQIFKDHVVPMERINEVSNSFKHSFIASEAHDLFGKDEPVVNCLDLTRNNARKGATWHSYFLREIVNDYWTFFTLSRDALKTFQWNDQGDSKPDEAPM